jgi:tetratricopeptide (TPR) repeat protein
MGAARLLYDWNWAEAERELKRAQILNPNDAEAHNLFGYYLKAMGRLDEANVETRRSQELDPLSLMINTDIGVNFYYARRYDEAIAQNEKTVNLDPRFFIAYLWLGQAYEQKKMYPEAIATFQKGMNVAERHPQLLASLGRAYALAGQTDKAQKALVELREMAKRRYVSPYLLAVVYAGLGDRDQTFAWLEKAYQDRSFFLIWLKVEPRFDNLRDDPRFGDLVRRVGLPQ